MKVVAVIPARLGSTRFPGKPLAGLLGRPMIEHVYKRVQLCRLLKEVYVATCDEEIAAATRNFGGKSLMTSPTHERASDRTAEAARGLDADVVVMVQGDEPMVVPEMIERAVEPFRDPSVLCVNLASPILSEKEYLDPNTIKVVMGRNGNALYFSREPIPSPRRAKFGAFPAFKQVCIIPFRKDFLFEFAGLAPTPLEASESIDMLRALEHGFPVRLVRTDVATHAVDTPEDLREVERLMRNDPLLLKYNPAGVQS